MSKGTPTSAANAAAATATAGVQYLSASGEGPWFISGLSQTSYAAAQNTYASVITPSNATDGAGTFYIALSEATAVTRIAGTNWDDTMEQLYKQASFPTDGTQATWVIATANGYQDALAASGLAGALKCPILMTDGQTLTPTTASMLNKYSKKPSAGNVTIIMGDKKAISEDVENAIRALPRFYGADPSTLTVKRLAGAESWDAALEARKVITGETTISGLSFTPSKVNKENAIVCTSGDFADAMSVSSYAYATGTPIILTNGEGILSDKVAKGIGSGYQTDGTTLPVMNALIVGGKKAVSPVTETQLDGANAVSRVAGLTAYDTSNQIAKSLLNNGKIGQFDPVAGFVAGTAGKVCVTTGENYLDALAASMYAGRDPAKAYTICLVADGQTTTIAGAITDNAAINNNKVGLTGAAVIGGKKAVSEKLFYDVNQVLTVEDSGNQMII